MFINLELISLIYDCYTGSLYCWTIVLIHFRVCGFFGKNHTYVQIKLDQITLNLAQSCSCTDLSPLLYRSVICKWVSTLLILLCYQPNHFLVSNITSPKPVCLKKVNAATSMNIKSQYS